MKVKHFQNNNRIHMNHFTLIFILTLKATAWKRRNLTEISGSHVSCYKFMFGEENDLWAENYLVRKYFDEVFMTDQALDIVVLRS